MNQVENRELFKHFMGTLKNDQLKIAKYIFDQTDIFHDQWVRILKMEKSMVSITKEHDLIILHSGQKGSDSDYIEKKLKYSRYSYKKIKSIIIRHKKYIHEEMEVFNKAVDLLYEGHEVLMEPVPYYELPSFF